MLTIKSVTVAAGTILAVFGLAQTGQAQDASKTTQGQVTFAKDVAPILQRTCQNCHRPGSIGPMSLLTYEDARPWARSIKQQVTMRNMPPWYIDQTVGIHDFKNDISLSDAQIATISKWVDDGAPMGNVKDLPPARQFDDTDRWHIGKPDVVVTLKKEVTVKGKQADQWLDLEMEDLGLKTNRYIQAMEIKPIKGVKVVHHVESSLIDPDDESQAARQHLEEYAVGKFGDKFPEGSGMLVKPGSKILANVHLHADGEDTPVNLAIALKLYPEGEVPKHVAHAQQLGSAADLDIRPNQKNVRADGYTILPKPAIITAFQPHMHNRGQAQCLELIYPQQGSGDRPVGVRTETVSCVDRFKFDWHVVYEYADDVAPIVPAGTVLHVISLYDNTAGNKFDPDPSNWVGYGNRTIDEMGFSWINWYYLTDEEYKEAIARRQATNKAASASSASR
jgi:mono/diheme cytochrome c family protein